MALANPGPQQVKSGYYAIDLKADRTVVFTSPSVNGYNTSLYVYHDLGKSPEAYGPYSKLEYIPTLSDQYYLNVSANSERTMTSADGSDFANAYPLGIEDRAVHKSSYSIPANAYAYYKVSLQAGEAIGLKTLSPVGIAVLSSDQAVLAESASKSIMFQAESAGTYYVRIQQGGETGKVTVWSALGYLNPGPQQVKSGYYAIDLKADRTVVFTSPSVNGYNTSLYVYHDLGKSPEAYGPYSKLEYIPTLSDQYYLNVSANSERTMTSADGSDFANAYLLGIEDRAVHKSSYSIPANAYAYYKVSLQAGEAIGLKTLSPVGIAVLSSDQAVLAESASQSIMFQAESVGTYYVRIQQGGETGKVTVWSALGYLNPGPQLIKSGYYAIDLKADRTVVFTSPSVNGYNTSLYVYHDLGKSPEAYGPYSKLEYIPTLSDQYYLNVSANSERTMTSADGSDFANAYLLGIEDRAVHKSSYSIPANAYAYYKVSLQAGEAIGLKTLSPVGIAVLSSDQAVLAESASQSIMFQAESVGTYYVRIQQGGETGKVTVWSALGYLNPGPQLIKSGYYATDLEADRTVVFTSPSVNGYNTSLYVYHDLGKSPEAYGPYSKLEYIPTLSDQYYLNVSANSERTMTSVDGSDFANAYLLGIEDRAVHKSSYSIPANAYAYYKVSLQAGEAIGLKALSPVGIAVLSSDQAMLAESASKSIMFQAENAGTYYVRIQQGGETGKVTVWSALGYLNPGPQPVKSGYYATDLKADRTVVFTSPIINGYDTALYVYHDLGKSHEAYGYSKLVYIPTLSDQFYLRVSGNSGSTLNSADGSDFANAYPLGIEEGKIHQSNFSVPVNAYAYYKVNLLAGQAFSVIANEVGGLAVLSANNDVLASSSNNKIVYLAESSGTYFVRIQQVGTKGPIKVFASLYFIAPGPQEINTGYYSIDVKANRTIVIAVDTTIGVNNLYLYKGTELKEVATGRSNMSYTPDSDDHYFVRTSVSDGTLMASADGSDYDQAYPIVINVLSSNTIPAHESSYYKVQLQSGKYYSFMADTGNGISLYDQYGNYKGGSNDIILDYLADADGLYYVRLLNASDQRKKVGFGVYEVFMDQQFGEIDDSGYSEFGGQLNSYRRYIFQLRGAKYMAILNTNGSVLQRSTSPDHTITFSPSASGQYWIRVYGDPGESFVVLFSDGLSGNVAVQQINKIDPSTVDTLTLVEDPIDTSTGAHVISLSKLSQEGTLPFGVQLNYNSLFLNNGILGRGWSHQYEARLLAMDNGSLQLKWGANRYNTFWSKDANTYTSSEQAVKRDTIIKNADGTYELKRADHIRYQFDTQGNLTSLINAQGQSLLFAYNNAGTLSKVTNALTGQTLQFTYDEYGRLRKVKDGIEREINFGYDESNNLTQMSDESGSTYTYSYDAMGRILTGTDRDGVQVFKDTYDSLGRVVKQVDALGAISIFQYDESTQPGYLITTVTNREGKISKLYHDSQYKLVKKIDEAGGVTSYSYDIYGNRSKMIDPAGQTSHMTYDERGNLLSIQDSAGKITRMVYDAQNRITRLTNAAGNNISYEYDGNNNLLSLTDLNGNRLSYTYDIKGLLVAETAPNGGVTSYAYNDNHQVAEVTDPEGNTTLYSYDAAGRLIQTSDPSGYLTQYAYDRDNNLTQITDELGNLTTIIYNSFGAPVKQIDALGNETTYKYNGNGKLIEKTDALGFITRYTYDAVDRLTTVTDALGNQSRLGYDAKGRLKSSTDVLGNQTVYEYDPLDRLLRTIYPEGNAVSVVYNPAGDVIQSIDSLGNKKLMDYDATGHITSFIDPAGAINAYTYDAAGQLLTETDSLGSSTAYTYDSVGNITSVTDAVGHKKSYVYNKNNDLVSIMDSVSGTMTMRYDANGRLVEKTDSLGYSTLYEYDGKNRLVQEIDPAGARTQYEYDELDRNIRTTNAEGHSETYVYDALGRLVQSIDANGFVTQFSYDAVGNMLSATDPLGHIRSYTYDAAGHLLTETDGNGNVTAYSYNKNGMLTKKTDALGYVTTLHYDSENRLIKVTNPLGNSVRYQYDALGRLVATINELDQTVRSVYDAAGRLIQSIDASGTVAYSATYDNVGHVTSVSDALGSTTSLNYDAAGRVIQKKDALDRTLVYQYDALDRMISVTDPLEGISAQTFDTAGNLTSYTDPNQDRTSYSFNKLGQVIQTTFAYGGSIYYTYDSKGHLVLRTNARAQQAQNEYDAAGRLTRTIELAGEVTYSYDNNDNVLSVTDAVYGNKTRTYDALNRVLTLTDSRNQTIGYTYDAAGRLAKITYPDGKNVSYAYDAADRMIAVTDWAGRVTRYEYDVNGRLVKTKRTDGSIETRIYDTAGKLLQLRDVAADGTVWIEDGYTYDEIGNVSTEAEKSYIYDPLNRLITTNDTQYAYDAAGNLTMISGDADISMNFGSNNRLLSFNEQDIQYDADGNMLSGPLHGQMDAFVYDSRNRLIQAGEIRYTYDAEDVRTSLISVTEATYYVTDTASYLSQVLMETDESGAPNAYYIYGLGLLGRQDADGTYSTYHFDRRGSTTVLTDIQGQRTDSYEYGAYGELLLHEGETNNPFLYNGRDGVMTDPNGLYYMRARYYSPEIKRFVNRDVVQGSIAEGASLNRYAYVNGNPVSYIDPFGLSRDEDNDGFLDWAWRASKATADFLILDDVKTLSDSNASWLDKAFAATTFIPGGKIINVLSKGKKLIKIGSKVDDVAQLAKTEKKVTNSVKLQPGSSRAAKQKEYDFFGKGCNCFTAGTKVITDQGERNIEDIKVGDRVLSKDDETGEIAYKEVLNLFRNERDVIYKLTVNGQLIETTFNHPFWVAGKGWVLAVDLEEGDQLQNSNGELLTIEEITIVKLEEKVTVYNFEVADFHTYFVSDLSIWVHNTNTKNCVPEGVGGIPKRNYEPSPKHDPQSGWGSPNPIPDAKTGQELLDGAYSSSKNKQLYNIYEGKLVKFQPDGEAGWHPYEVVNPAKEVPADVLRQMVNDGKISKADYNKMIKNNK